MCLFVCLSIVILFILEHSKYLKQDVLRELQGSLKGVCLKFQGCFKEVLRVFTTNIKGVLRNFEGCFKEGSRVVQGNFRELSRVLKEIPKGVQVRLK